MEILPESTSNSSTVGKIVTNRFTHIVLSALRRPDIENKLAWLVLAEPKESYKDGDGDTSFQQKSFQDDGKYEHVGQDTRSQDGNDDQDIRGKDLKISELKTMTKAQDQRLHIMKEQAYNIIKTKDSRTQRQSNLNKFKEARFKISPQEFEDHSLGEIVSLKYSSMNMEAQNL
ncbi:hypothetical protein Tco_0717146 [Tanacetum coccineum]